MKRVLLLVLLAVPLFAESGRNDIKVKKIGHLRTCPMENVTLVDHQFRSTKAGHNTSFSLTLSLQAKCELTNSVIVGGEATIHELTNLLGWDEQAFVLVPRTVRVTPVGRKDQKRVYIISFSIGVDPKNASEVSFFQEDGRWESYEIVPDVNRDQVKFRRN